MGVGAIDFERGFLGSTEGSGFVLSSLLRFFVRLFEGEFPEDVCTPLVASGVVEEEVVWVADEEEEVVDGREEERVEEEDEGGTVGVVVAEGVFVVGVVTASKDAVAVPFWSGAFVSVSESLSSPVWVAMSSSLVFDICFCFGILSIQRETPTPTQGPLLLHLLRGCGLKKSAKSNRKPPKNEEHERKRRTRNEEKEPEERFRGTLFWLCWKSRRKEAGKNGREKDDGQRGRAEKGCTRMQGEAKG